MADHQPGIIAPVPKASRYLFFQLRPAADPKPALERLIARDVDEHTVVGLGPSLVTGIGREIDGLREFPSLIGPGINIPSTPASLWGEDPGDLVHAGRGVAGALTDSFILDLQVDDFFYAGGRDLTGYEDGTENPTGDKAYEVAFVSGRGPGLDGSSFVAVQRWETRSGSVSSHAANRTGQHNWTAPH